MNEEGTPKRSLKKKSRGNPYMAMNQPKFTTDIRNNNDHSTGTPKAIRFKRGSEPPEVKQERRFASRQYDRIPRDLELGSPSASGIKRRRTKKSRKPKRGKKSRKNKRTKRR